MANVQGDPMLEQVAEELGLEFADDGEYDTLAGFLISEFGYIPDTGESLHYEGFRFVVQEADERRIIRIAASKDQVQPVPVRRENAASE